MKRAVFLILALAAGNAAAAYRCLDEKGTTHIGDTPPAACAKVPMYEISRTGAVLRKIDPTPTAEELKVREAAAAERKDRERAAAEQRRKDMALLNTYSTTAEFDTARDRNVEPVVGRIKSAKERIVAVEKRGQEISDEMEFYKAGKSKTSKKTTAREVPIQLVTDHERVTAEKAALNRSVVGYEREITEIRGKFDADKRRWLELKNNPGLLKGEATATASSAPATAANPRGALRCGEKTVSCRKGESFLCLQPNGTWVTVPCESSK